MITRHELLEALHRERDEVISAYLKYGKNDRASGVKEGADSRDEILLEMFEALSKIRKVGTSSRQVAGDALKSVTKKSGVGK